MNLAQRLRADTSALHRRAERSGCMPALLRGQLPKGPYAQLLRNLHAIYFALEHAWWRQRLSAPLAACQHPALARCAALESDLQALHGASWSRALPLLPAAADYAAHLRRLAVDEPARLLAHAYVRYLGDLSGGQQLQHIVSDALALRDGRGTAFYRFEPADPAALARDFRGALAAMPSDDALADALVAEAQQSFERHCELFEQVAAAGG